MNIELPDDTLNTITNALTARVNQLRTLIAVYQDTIVCLTIETKQQSYRASIAAIEKDIIDILDALEYLDHCKLKEFHRLNRLNNS